MDLKTFQASGEYVLLTEESETGTTGFVLSKENVAIHGKVISVGEKCEGISQGDEVSVFARDAYRINDVVVAKVENVIAVKKVTTADA